MPSENGSGLAREYPWGSSSIWYCAEKIAIVIQPVPGSLMMQALTIGSNNSVVEAVQNTNSSSWSWTKCFFLSTLSHIDHVFIAAIITDFLSVILISKKRKPDKLRNIQPAPRLRANVEICAESGDFRTSVAIESSTAASAERISSGIR